MAAGGAEGASVEYTLYTDGGHTAARHASALSHAGLVVRTGAPLLLAITGSAFTPLPCAFSLTGLATGAALLLVIGGANCYTTVLMVRAAAALNVSGYEEVLRAAGGARALRWTQLALVVLLFGTLCGALSAVGETGVRALSELASETDSPLVASLASTPAVVGGCAAAILFPLSLASLGESPLTSAVGVAVMIALVSYILYAAIAMPQVHRELGSGSIDDVSPFAIAAALPEAASTFGYAFYIQPVALPLLRALPPGEAGATALADALKLTFALTCAAYLCVGIGGYVYFGRGHVPQDLLQGFHGRAGGALAGIFCAYLCLCFSPILARDPTLPQTRAGPAHISVRGGSENTARSQHEPLPWQVPLRELLVRLHRRRGGTPRAPSLGAALGGYDDDAVLPPAQNAALTAALVGGAAGVALLLPDASEALFALTGATGVCAVGYVLPIWAASRLRARGRLDPPPRGKTTARAQFMVSPHAWPPYTPEAREAAAVRERLRAALASVGAWLAAAAPACVLCLGVLISALSTVSVVGKLSSAERDSEAVCMAS